MALPRHVARVTEVLGGRERERERERGRERERDPGTKGRYNMEIDWRKESG